MQILITTIIAVGLSIASTFGIIQKQPKVSLETQDYISEYVTTSLKRVQLGTSVLPIGGITYNLAGAGVSPSATSITLQSLTVPQTGQPILDSDLSETFYITLEPGNRSRQEIVSCTTVTQSATSATLSGCSRGLSPITPYTASTTLRFSHAGGSQIIFSDPPQLFNEYAGLKNDVTITGPWTFDNDVMPKLDTYTAPTSSVQLATKGYVDAVAFSGAGAIAATESAIGYSELATQLETASSTSSGSSGPLVIQAKNATSTYNPSTAGLRVVVTQNNGQIDQNFLPATTTVSKEYATTTYIGDFLAFEIGKSRQIITTTGTTTWARPEGIRRVFVEVIGPGGGGGSCSAIAGNYAGGAGGAGGGYANEIVDVSATSSIQVHIGAGTAAQVTGTRTTFGTIGFEFLSATGGVAGAEGAGGINGGIGTGGDINKTGEPGGVGGRDDTSATAGVKQGGNGGGSPYGSGGLGTNGGDGGAGTEYGSGGGGAACDNGSQTGGAGTQGIIIVRW